MLSKIEYVKYMRNLHEDWTDKQWSDFMKDKEIVICRCGLSMCKGWAIINKK